MAITKEIIEYIAMLARLRLDENEKINMVSDISKVMYYFDKLKELDTSNIDAMEFLSMEEDVFENALRNDVVGKSYERTQLLHPEQEEGSEYFTVPKVVE
jgi:aspartyl-tRNA(Asn)/glutamyl-tRNA(Gln) amidotransferase subunit C